jgi:hypothetical protein
LFLENITFPDSVQQEALIEDVEMPQIFSLINCKKIVFG